MAYSKQSSPILSEDQISFAKIYGDRSTLFWQSITYGDEQRFRYRFLIKTLLTNSKVCFVVLMLKVKFSSTRSSNTNLCLIPF